MRSMIAAALLAVTFTVQAFAQNAVPVNPNAEIHLTLKELQDIVAAQVAVAEAKRAQAVAQAAIKKIDAQLAPQKHVAAPKPNVAPPKGK